MKRILRILGWLIVSLVLLLTLILAAYYQADIPLETLKVQYATPPSQFMQIGELSVHFRDEGNPKDSLPLVLIHGTSSSLLTWNAVTDSLTSDFRIIRFDLPAFGLTGPSLTDDYSIEAYVAFIDRALQKLGIDSCVIAGNSLGGQIAWSYAYHHPETTRKLILLDAAGYPPQKAPGAIGFILGRTPLVRELLTVITPRFIIRKSLEDSYSDKRKVSDQLVDQYYQLLCRAGNREALLARLNQQQIDHSQQIQAITVPTLILWGDEDQLIPVSTAHQFHDDLPNDTLIIFDNAGHIPMEEVPERVAPAIRNFLES